MILRNQRQLLNRQNTLNESDKGNNNKSKPNDSFLLIYHLILNKKSKRNHIQEIKAIITTNYLLKIKKV